MITRHSCFLYPVLVGDLSSPTSNTFCVQSDLGDHGSILNLSFAQTVLPSLLILCGDVESNPGPESKSNNIKFPIHCYFSSSISSPFCFVFVFCLFFICLSFVAQLTVNDLFEVTQYLGTLLPEDLIRLGLALGLQYNNLKMMNPLREDMVSAWLNQQDNVMKKSGKPTWESLMRALRTIGHEGLAQKIAQGKDWLTMKYNSHCYFNRSTENSISRICCLYCQFKLQFRYVI